MKDNSIAAGVYLLSIPIGNDRDLSLRALDVLSAADLIIGEEHKTTARFLKRCQLEKKFLLYNEHSTEPDKQDLLARIEQVKISVVISDSGSPVLEDPAKNLTTSLIQRNINLHAVPGASALECALAICGFPTSPFTFAGFLPRDTAARQKNLRKLLALQHTIIVYETPYRYKKVIHDLAQVDKDCPVFIGLNLTTAQEQQIRGNAGQLVPKLDSLPKALPVIVFAGSHKKRSNRQKSGR